MHFWPFCKSDKSSFTKWRNDRNTIVLSKQVLIRNQRRRPAYAMYMKKREINIDEIPDVNEAARNYDLDKFGPPAKGEIVHLDEERASRQIQDAFIAGAQWQLNQLQY